jgi:hypothetical protein
MLRPQVVPRSTILPLLLLISTAIFLLSASSMTNAEIIYKPGDWLLYRFTFIYTDIYTRVECTQLERVTVRNIEGTMVFNSFSFEKLEKWDDPMICMEINVLVSFALASSSISDISQARPERLKFFINPAYTGEYNINETTTIRYYKGILTYLEVRPKITGPGLSLIRIQLIDTSIQELKASITPLGMSITMIGLILVVLATIITVIAIFIVVRRRHKTTETPLNQSQGT